MITLYSTNIRTLINAILPPQVRSTSNIDWIRSLLSGLQTNMNSMNASFGTIPTKVLFNGSHINLRAAITFLTGIPCDVVTNSSSVQKTYIWNEAESLFDYIYNQIETSTGFFIWNESELAGLSAFDFTVKIHVADYTGTNINLITAIVQQFKLAGKSFNIDNTLP